MGAGGDLIAVDPTAGVRHRVKEKARDRALIRVSAEGEDEGAGGRNDPAGEDSDNTELACFWHGCDKLGWPFGPLFKLLLLTAQRREEVGGMRWSEIDLDKRIWTIPRERAKSDRAHIVHLSAPAIEIIEGLPHTGELVFSSNG